MIYNALSFIICDPVGIRTQDPLIKSQMLYQLSYEISLNFLLFRVPFSELRRKYRTVFLICKCYHKIFIKITNFFLIKILRNEEKQRFHAL